MGIFTGRYGDIKLGSVLGTIALAVATTIGGCKVLNNYEYSSGSRAGMVNKMSHKGIIWKTYEG